MSNSNQQGNLKQFLLAGACAGTAVDTALFPLGKEKKVFFLYLFFNMFLQTQSRQDCNHNMVF